jgi:hypothetical protein
LTTCIDTLGGAAAGIYFCPLDTCDAFYDTTDYGRTCNCVDWQGNPIPDCTPKDNMFPVQQSACYNADKDIWVNVLGADCANLGASWFVQTCYCCCRGSGTPGAPPSKVAVLGGERNLGDVRPGDSVMAARRDGDRLTWDPAVVGFAGGLDDPRPAARSVGLELGDGRAAVVAADLLLLTDAGTLRRADALRPGCDRLVVPDGQPLRLVSVDRDVAPRPVGQIAVGDLSYEEFDGSPDRHLLAIDGLVAGDYVTQLFQGSQKMAPHVERAGAPYDTTTEGNAR